MRIIKKIKEHGIRESIRILFKYRVVQYINNAFYYIGWIVPINKRLIVMESEGDLSDNAYALYDYMRHKGYLKKYKVVWLVDNLRKAKEFGINNGFENTKFAIKVPTNIQIKRSIYLATCKWYIYDHCNLLEKLKKRENCRIINLCHGTTFKAYKGASKKVRDSIKRKTNLLCATSDFWVKYTADFYSGKYDCTIALGYSRCDYLLNPNNDKAKRFAKNNGWIIFDKILFWMPTFRNSIRGSLTESYFSNETGLPILTKNDDLNDLNCFLKDKNILLIFKIHHLQVNSNCFKKPYSNIKVLRDEELQQNNLQLYQIVPMADALITDYSSIGNDYILLDRPMIFTLDDYEEYRSSRGFSIDDPAQYFPGHHVFNKEELFDAINDVANGRDVYKERRHELLPIMHKYQDGNSSKRIVKYIGL